ncbi:MAG: zinc ribbon domain-containing protein [Burkholderiales bacterium]|nr:zinc ribbon domain-containing protein [Burkholderiales bacterium]
MEQADLQPTRPESAFVKTFPCAGCGAKLTFAPGTRELRCEYCGTANAIAENDARVEELDFDTYLKALEGKMEVQEVEEVRCDKCGAGQTLAGSLFAGHCTFCGAAIVSKSYASRRIKPKSLVPFQVNRQRAAEAFRRWVRSLWLAPGDLKRYAQSDAGLTGVYLPYWTYDCNTASDYAGERGDDYYTTETYTTQDSQGRSSTQTRRVKHTRWTPASGHVEKFHDDVLVMASKTLPAGITDSVMRFNLKGLVPYQPEFVSGYQAEAYQVTLREGFPIAKQSIDEAVRALIRRDIGGDQQRIHSVSTRYADVKFKHVLLPAWISAYRYRDKVYRFLINGQTGEVSGESPKSWWKIALLVAAVLVVLFLVLLAGGKG